jgi:hypothetical protein
MHVRSQIALDPELKRRAQAKAAELGISLAEYMRRLVAQDLGASKPKLHISAIFDLGASKAPTDIAHDKDKMLGEAIWMEHVRKTTCKPLRRTPRKLRRR